MSKHYVFTIICALVFIEANVVAQCVSTQYSQTCAGGQDGAGGNPYPFIWMQQGIIESPSSLDDFNCHQYVRGVLEKNYASTYCGTPYGSPQTRSANNTKFGSLPSGNIKNDPKYLELCSYLHAQAISFTSSDHSAVILNYGSGYASTPGWGSALYFHTGATWGAGGCLYRYYAYIGNNTISSSGSGTLSSGSQRTFTISKPAYVNTISWSVDTRYLEIVSGQGTTSLVVKGKCGSGYSGVNSAYVNATYYTTCSTSATVTKNVNVDCGGVMPCEGTINGSLLYTVNGVIPNYSNTVIMNGNSPTSYSWTKTSGTAYWSTASNGKYLYVTIPSGSSASFYLTSSAGCNRTIAFSSGYGYRVAIRDEPENTHTLTSDAVMSYKIYKLFDGSIVKEGRYDGDDRSVTEGLPSGSYIIEMASRRKKVFIR